MTTAAQGTTAQGTGPDRIPGPLGLPDHLIGMDRTLVMGILNATPDSFSDGGEHAGPAASIAHGRALAAAGADIVDIGGESTRPGAARVAPEQELDRVLPAVRDLSDRGIAVSVDTMRAEVASAAVAAGAVIINDVSGGRADPEMGPTAARLRTRLGTPPVLVAMHWRGHSEVMRDLNSYRDVARDVAAELAASLAALEAAGVERDSIVIDPGLGFSKEGDQNWELMAGLEALADLGLPILVAGSRKRFLQALDADRDAATAALTTAAALQGAWGVRVHEAGSSLAAVRVAARLRRHGMRLVGPRDGAGA